MTAQAHCAAAEADTLRRRTADRTPVIDWYGLSESNLPETALRQPADPTPTAAPGRLAAAGRAIAGLARRIAHAIVEARMAQAKRMIALEGWRVGEVDSRRALDVERIGSRYY